MGCLVIVGPHFASPAVSLESISQHCHFNCNCLHHTEPPLVTISCSLVRLWSPAKRVKKREKVIKLHASLQCVKKAPPKAKSGLLPGSQPRLNHVFHKNLSYIKKTKQLLGTTGA